MNSDTESSDEDYDQRQFCSKDKMCPSNFVCNSGVCTHKVRGPPWTLQTASNLLGVSPNASDNDIKKTRRKLSLIYHPDRCPEQSVDKFLPDVGSPSSKTECTEITKEINSAFDFLISQEKTQEKTQEKQQEKTQEKQQEKTQEKPQEKTQKTKQEGKDKKTTQEDDKTIKNIQNTKESQKQIRNEVLKMEDLSKRDKVEESVEQINTLEKARNMLEESTQDRNTRKTSQEEIDRTDAIKESKKHIRNEVLKIEDPKIRTKVDAILKRDNVEGQLKQINTLAVNVKDKETRKILDEITHDITTIEAISSLNTYQTFELRHKKIIKLLQSYDSSIDHFESTFKVETKWPTINPLTDAQKKKFEQFKIVEGRLEEIKEMLESLELTKNQLSAQSMEE